MTIANYSDLNTAVANWTARADLTSRIPEGIVLAEAKMNRYMRTKDMVTQNTTFSIATEYVAVPTNFGGVKTFYLNTASKAVLDWMPDELITSNFPSGTGQPEVYGVQGSNFRFAPVPGSAYTATLVYYLKVPALTVSATTNWMITNNPDAYLYGVLAEMEALAKNFPAAQGWEAMFYRSMDEIKLSSNRDTYSGDAALFARPG